MVRDRVMWPQPAERLLSKLTLSIHPRYLGPLLLPPPLKMLTVPGVILSLSSPILHSRQPETAVIRAAVTQPVYRCERADRLQQANSESISRERQGSGTRASPSYTAPESASPAYLGKPLHRSGTTHLSGISNPDNLIHFQSIEHRAATQHKCLSLCQRE